MRFRLIFFLLALSQIVYTQHKLTQDKNRLKDLMKSIVDSRSTDRHETISLCMEAVPLAREFNHIQALDEIYYTLSNMYFWINRDLSIKYAKKGIELAKKKHKDIDLGRYYVMLGKVAIAREQFHQGIQYFEKADSIYLAAQNVQEHGWVRSNLGNAYYMKKEYYKAIGCLKESIRIDTSRQSQSASPLSLINLGNCYLETGRPDEALKLYERSLKISASIQNSYALATSHLVMGKFHNRYEQYHKSLDHGLKSLNYSRESNNYYAMHLAYDHLYETYKKMNDFQASLCYLELKESIVDSLEKQESDAALRNLESSFALQKQALDLELLEKEKVKLHYKVKAESAQNQLLFLLLVSFGIVCIALVALFMSSQKANRMKQKLTAASAEVRNRELTNLALFVKQRSLFIDVVRSDLRSIRYARTDEKRMKLISDLSIKVSQYGGDDNKNDQLKQIIDLNSKDFSQRLKGKYPALTDYESQLVQLIRMNLSSKEIAVLLDITPHSVNVSRYRLRKKLNIKREDSLTDCFAKL